MYKIYDECGKIIAFRGEIYKGEKGEKAILPCQIISTLMKIDDSDSRRKASKIKYAKLIILEESLSGMKTADISKKYSVDRQMVSNKLRDVNKLLTSLNIPEGYYCANNKVEYKCKLVLTDEEGDILSPEEGLQKIWNEYAYIKDSGNLNLKENRILRGIIDDAFRDLSNQLSGCGNFYIPDYLTFNMYASRVDFASVDEYEEDVAIGTSSFTVLPQKRNGLLSVEQNILPIYWTLKDAFKMRRLIDNDVYLKIIIENNGKVIEETLEETFVEKLQNRVKNG